MKVYYLGPESSYSHIVATRFFKQPEADLSGLSSFNAIFKQILAEKNSLGLLPIENSITSSVHENIDWIFQRPCYIVGEAFLEIHLNLIGLTGAVESEIKQVLSHPKALQQCSDYIEKNKLLGIEATSTSEAAKLLKENRNVQTAVIGGKLLTTGDSDLTVIKADIGNVKNNFTRFVIVSASKDQVISESRNKISVSFQLKHEPGSLLKVLEALFKRQANLTKIESRPIPAKEWEYEFWIDIELGNADIDQLLEAIKDNTLQYRLLGFYKQGDVIVPD